MGFPTRQHDHARHRNEQSGRADRRQAPPSAFRSRLTNCLTLSLTLWLSATVLAADQIKIATFNTELSRKGPGILLRDINRGDDAQITAVSKTIAKLNADIIVLQGVDYDLELAALGALANAIAHYDVDYQHRFSLPPNAGLQTYVDLDGDGETAGPGDAQGFGHFYGQGSMAILSRYPILSDQVQDHSDLLWRDLPDSLIPLDDSTPFPSQDAHDIQRLSSHGHWVVPVQHPDLGVIRLLAYHAAPPAFDNQVDRNARRNHDETAFWMHYLNGAFGPVEADRFVIAGTANIDPTRSTGRVQAITALLNGPVQDTVPNIPTVHWPQTGKQRVDYVLPSHDWKIVDAGVQAAPENASRHHAVWVILTR